MLFYGLTQFTPNSALLQHFKVHKKKKKCRDLKYYYMICVKVLGKGCHLSGPNIGLHLKTQKLSGSTSMITSVLTGTDVVTIDDKVYSWLEYLFIRWAWKCLYISKGILLFKDTCTLNFVEINVSLQLFPLHLRR